MRAIMGEIDSTRRGEFRMVTRQGVASDPERVSVPHFPVARPCLFPGSMDRRPRGL